FTSCPNERGFGQALSGNHAAHRVNHLGHLSSVFVRECDTDECLCWNQVDETQGRWPPERLFREKGVGGKLNAVIAPHSALRILEIYRVARFGSDDQEVELSGKSEPW